MPIQPGSEQLTSLSRRNFLKLLGAGAAALSPLTIPKNPVSNNATSLSPREKDAARAEGIFYLGESIQVGNLEVTPLVTEHSLQAWGEHGEEIKAYIDQYQVIIPEYFPWEQKQQLEKHTLLQAVLDKQYREANWAFDQIDKYCLQTDKELWVVDPSYSEAFALYRVYNNSLFLAIAPVLSLIYTYYSRQVPERDKRDKTIHRIIDLLVHSGILSQSVYTLFGDRSPQENIFRRTLVAQNLIRLGNMMPQKSKALIIYPKGHWQTGDAFNPGISELLQKEQLLRMHWDVCKKLRTHPEFSELFRARNYISTGGQWVEQPGFRLE